MKEIADKTKILKIIEKKQEMKFSEKINDFETIFKEKVKVFHLKTDYYLFGTSDHLKVVNSAFENFFLVKPETQSILKSFNLEKESFDITSNELFIEVMAHERVSNVI